MTTESLKAELVRRHFSASAHRYAAHAVVQPRVVERVMERLQQLNPEVGDVALDLGTGAGALLSAYRQRFCPAGPLIGCDHADRMCQQAVANVPGVIPVVCDVRTLPFAGNQFSLAMSASVYQWVEPLPSAFAEVARILKPGGWFVVALFGQKTLYELKTSYREAQRLTGAMTADHLQQFPSLGAVQNALSSVAAFEGIAVEQAFEVEYHADVRALLRSLKAIGAHNASALQPRGLASRQRMLNMMKIYEQAYGREGNIPATYEVILASARKTGAGG